MFRQWNWWSVGRVFLRRSGGEALEPHPDFSPRLHSNYPSPTMLPRILSGLLPEMLPDIKERFSLLEHAWPDQVGLALAQ